MNPTLSIIVPVFKSEKYLRVCIDSILAQSFNDFELILVDDGSPDNSGNICDEYARMYADRVKVIHKSNGGASSARNAGLNQAKGKFVGFVDSDDYIDPEMFASTINILESKVADVVEIFFNKDNSHNHLFTSGEVSVLSNREALIELFCWNISTSLCTKVWRKEVLQDFRLEEGLINEDFRFICELFIKDIKVVILPEAYYCYRPTPGSVTRVMRPNFFDIFTNLDYIETLLPQDDKKLQRYFRHYAMTMHIMSGVKIVRGKHKKEYKDWLKTNRRFILRNLGLIVGPSPLSLRWRLKAIYTFL